MTKFIIPVIYVFSGLGADERAFARINWGDIEVHFVPWISPEENESIGLYAARLSSFIIHPHSILIGLSFGGMVAQEVAHHCKASQVILISSFKGPEELPLSYRIASRLKLNKFMPMQLLKSMGPFATYLFGIKGKEDASVLQSILADTDTRFLSWAINQLLHWEGNLFRNTTAIHGTADRILPVSHIHADYLIQGAGHFMIWDHAKKISKHIQSAIRDSRK